MSTTLPQSLKLVTGNTYPVKERLKALGARWNPDAKGWAVPVERYAEALAILATAPAPAPRRTFSGGRRPTTAYRGRRTGCSCGSIEDVPRSSDCAQCQHDY